VFSNNVAQREKNASSNHFARVAEKEKSVLEMSVRDLARRQDWEIRGFDAVTKRRVSNRDAGQLSERRIVVGGIIIAFAHLALAVRENATTSR